MRIRPNLATAPATLIASFRKGVAAMQARPVEQPAKLAVLGQRAWHPGPAECRRNLEAVSARQLLLPALAPDVPVLLREGAARGLGRPELCLALLALDRQRAMPLPFRSPGERQQQALRREPQPRRRDQRRRPSSLDDVSVSPAFSFTNFTTPTDDLSFGGRTVQGSSISARTGQFETSPHESSTMTSVTEAG